MRFTDLTKLSSSAGVRYGVALLCVAAAIGVRWLLDPMLEGSRPFITVAGGVAAAVWLTRWRAAGVAAAVGFGASEYLFVVPRVGFELDRVLEDLITYGVSCTAIIWVGELMHVVNDRAKGEIAARKRTEEQLRESQQRLGLALQAAYCISFEWDIQRNEVRRFISLDPALPPTPGDAPSTFEAVRAKVHPDDQARFTENVQAALGDKDGRYENEFRILHPDGGVAWLYEWGRIERDPEGKPARLLGLSQDVTERKRAEDRLRRSDERFRSVLENSFDAAYRRDLRNDQYDFLSPRIEHVLGIAPGVLASLPVSAVVERIHPDDRERVREALQASFSSGHGNVDYRFRGDDGEYRWLADQFTIQRDAAGEPVFRSGSLRNITEQKHAEDALRRSEERFRKIFEHAVTGIAITDWKGTFLQCNPAYSRLVGYADDELRRLNFAELVHPDDRAENLRQIRRLLDGETAAFDIENRYVRKGGEPVWVRKFVSVLPDDSGRPSFLVALVTDMTERRRVSEELARVHEQLANHARHLDGLVEQRTTELRDLAQQLETFSYSVAHDLRAPLRSMRNFAELLEQDYGPRLDDTARDYLGRITRAAGRMDRLISDVLAYSRVTRSDAPLSAVDLDHLATEIIDGDPQFHEQADAIKVERPLPAVRGNPALLTQVLSNLVGNALKFVPPGKPPRVAIGAVATGERVRVWVQDEGIGIAPEQQSKLFGLFQRLHPASEYPGTGVGLATVKKAVERMGGQVGFESETGIGTRFWFELPRADRDEQSGTSR